jgi:hypothetical protein
VAGGFDSTVRRIEMAYTSRGQTDTVTQYDATSSGTVLDEVKYTYEDYGNVSKIEQDKDSAVSGGGNQYSVSYAYARAVGGRNTVRRTSVTYPDTFTWNYSYGSGSSINDNFSRVYQIKDKSEEDDGSRWRSIGRE